MKRSFCLFFLSFFAFTAPISAAEKIENFHADYQIELDTSLVVTETLDYYTDAQKHGLYRYIPEVYQDESQIRVDWDNIQILNERGQLVAHPFTATRENGDAVAQIGSASKTFAGARQYVISYTATHALRQYDVYDELYWDVTGEDWAMSIASASATLHSPHAEILEIKCTGGAFSATDELCDTQILDSQTATFNYPHQISPGQGLTIAVKLATPNNFTFPPPLSTAEENSALDQTLNNKFFAMLCIIVSVCALIVTVVSLIIAQKNRDEIFVDDHQLTLNPTGPTRKKPFFYRWPIAFWYEPFANITPAQSSYILTRKNSPDQVTSEIIWLAVHGYLKIEFVDPLAKKKDYLFTRLKSSDSKLTDFQTTLLNRLFQFSTLDAQKRPSITLKELKDSKEKNDFFGYIPTFNQSLKTSTISGGYLAKKIINPVFIILIAIIFIAIVIIFEGVSVFPIFVIPIILITNLGNKAGWWNGDNLGGTKYTARGSLYRSLILGLQDTLKLGKWRTEIQEKYLYLENVMPFAIALGQSEVLAQDMKALGLDQGFNTSNGQALYSNDLISYLIARDFINSFRRDFSTSYTAYNAARYSSSAGHSHSHFSSGGSGFSSGGFSSGGGHGGGGGSSW